MPQKFYEPEQLAEGSGVPCASFREDLKFCIRNTDCFLKEKKTPRECFNIRHPSIPEECYQLRQAFFECKRSLLDNRQRFRGRKDITSYSNKQ